MQKDSSQTRATLSLSLSLSLSPSLISTKGNGMGSGLDSWCHHHKGCRCVSVSSCACVFVYACGGGAGDAGNPQNHIRSPCTHTPHTPFILVNSHRGPQVLEPNLKHSGFDRYATSYHLREHIDGIAEHKTSQIDSLDCIKSSCGTCCSPSA